MVSPVWYQIQYPGGTVVATPTSVTPTTTTDYYLLSQNTYGCYDTAKVTLNVASPQTPNITTSVDVGCNTSTINLADYQGMPSQVGYTLEWHSANNTLAGTLLSNTVVSGGTYYLFEKAPSPSNCYSASDSLTANTAPSTPSVTSPQINLCPATTVNLTTLSAALPPSVSGGVFEWHVSNSSSSAIVSNQTAVVAGTYYLFEKSPTGCFSTGKTVQVVINVCCPAKICLSITVTRH